MKRLLISVILCLMIALLGGCQTFNDMESEVERMHDEMENIQQNQEKLEPDEEQETTASELEEKARENGLDKSGETVFIEVPESDE